MYNDMNREAKTKRRRGTKSGGEKQDTEKGGYSDDVTLMTLSGSIQVAHC
jgi:hypothetical protein